MFASSRETLSTYPDICCQQASSMGKKQLRIFTHIFSFFNHSPFHEEKFCGLQEHQMLVLETKHFS